MHIFPLKKAYVFLEAQGLGTEAKRIRVSPDRFGVLRSAMMVALLQSKGLLDQFVADWWPNGSFPEGRRHVNALSRIYERWKKSKEHSEEHMLLRQTRLVTNLKYQWQQDMFDAFREGEPERLPGKIADSERAVSTRLIQEVADPQNGLPFEVL